MKKKIALIGMSTLLTLGLAACNTEKTAQQSDSKAEETSAKEQTIKYLGKEYTLPANVDKIAAASLESMEDSAVLGIKPAATITVGGKIPEYLAKDLDGATGIGEKMQPDEETLLNVDPDVILWTSKSPENVTEKLNKVATTIPYSHVSANWKDNLLLLGGLAGKTDKAKQIISDYEKEAAQLKEDISGSVKDKKVLLVRVRGGNLYVYPQDVYFNSSLYNDFGIKVPEEIKPVKAQELVSLEKLADINPDYLFVQFADSENAKTPKALEDLQKNPIWKSIKAVQDDKVFVNSVDPLFQGGTAYSKQEFLKAAKKDLTK
ncbi:ABC transporter substrate-binding protein [Priestia filamentosa]|uniref:Iron-uptake system-binding protein n=1 Tax=Priestia filamentosa TaxID=1402861 RepID=A0A1X7DB65_9BACI|nr:ABC transporter substrate-binding protein [Priestia filamentosa]AKO93623.1 iron-uptake system-binding protein [Priestia filamentosa]MDT3763837.1 ABC transporter substrate-binding protein [Priestia filamentosa]OXS71680.1 iron-uptake system-binding protein [Priestia filamentosa]RJS67316.1 iron-uptake system-binding protein [Priestia filamentosa]WCM14485.1 ABC transporter substrate-binding protein [Priestia filamentosa]